MGITGRRALWGPSGGPRMKNEEAGVVPDDCFRSFNFFQYFQNISHLGLIGKIIKIHTLLSEGV